MKKNYVTFLLDMVTFDQEDVIRTSGAGATLAPSFNEAEKGESFSDLFGGN